MSIKGYIWNIILIVGRGVAIFLSVITSQIIDVIINVIVIVIINVNVNVIVKTIVIVAIIVAHIIIMVVVRAIGVVVVVIIGVIAVVVVNVVIAVTVLHLDVARVYYYIGSGIVVEIVEIVIARIESVNVALRYLIIHNKWEFKEEGDKMSSRGNKGSFDLVGNN